MSYYENHDEEQQKKEIEKLYKQQRAKRERNKAKTENSSTKFNLFQKNKLKNGISDYNSKITKFLKNEKS